METSLFLYNSFSRKKEAFKPLDKKNVRMYVCGPTVYDKSHIGHMVGPIIFDTIKRYLTYSGYEVTLVVNITDVDDKLIMKSRERGIPMDAIAEEMTNAEKELSMVSVLPSHHKFARYLAAADLLAAHLIHLGMH